MSDSNFGLQSLSDDITKVVDSLRDSVVSVASTGGRGFGSGVVWSDGFVITNSHVIHRSENAEIGLASGEKLKATVVGRDRESDLALLKVDSPGALKPIKLGDSSNLKVGQIVLAIANAFGGEPAATLGIITSSRRSIRAWGGQTFENVVVSDAKVNPGYSGGPLVDSSGRMIALNAAFAFSRALSIPVNTCVEIAEKLKKDGRIKRAYLGVVLDSIELQDQEQDSGLMVLSVSKESPAKSAGMAIGDIVIGFNGKKVSSYHELRSLLTERVIGNSSKISVLRGGKESELEITPADDQGA